MLFETQRQLAGKFGINGILKIEDKIVVFPDFIISLQWIKEKIEFRSQGK